jgi:hypothetical protein
MSTSIEEQLLELGEAEIRRYCQVQGYAIPANANHKLGLNALQSFAIHLLDLPSLTPEDGFDIPAIQAYVNESNRLFKIGWIIDLRVQLRKLRINGAELSDETVFELRNQIHRLVGATTNCSLSAEA